MATRPASLLTMSMVIKLSFLTKMGRKRRWQAKIHSLNFNPQDGDEEAEEVKTVLAKRYTRCYGRYKTTPNHPSESKVRKKAP